MHTERQLITLCLDNNRKAQRKLFNMYAPVLLGICCRYTKDRSEAEDVLQDAFVKIFKSLNQFEDKGSFEGWLKRIAVNTAITNYRQNLKHSYQDDITDINETRISNNAGYEADFTHEELLNVIKELPQGYQMVFNLYAIEGFKHREIAEMLKVDINTSKSQYSRARKLIQQKLEDLKNR